MKLSELCKAAHLSLPTPFAETEIESIVMDSRLVRERSLFICISGFHTDGHGYLAEAVAKGASAVLVQEGCEVTLPKGIFCLTAKNTRRAAAVLFNAFYGDPCSKLKFIGVTGTNGKTSITHMLRAILEASLCRCGLIGTVGCESVGRPLENRSSNPLANMTTPDPPELYRMLAQMVEDGVEYVLMEVTSHALTLGKLEPIVFEAGIFTNLTPEHLDFHRTMEAYAKAKAILASKSRLMVLNADSLYSETMRRAAKGKCVTCSTAKGSAGGDYLAKDIHTDLESGVEFELRSQRGSLRLRCPVPGEFTVENAMQAAVCALELGFPPAAVKTALASLSGIRGRMERIKLGVGADIRVIVDYAHTPDALENLLRTAREICGERERIVVLFGCGGDRDAGKRPMMGAVAERYADEVILTSDNSRSEDPNAILADIRAGMREGRETVIPDRADAIRHAILQARAGDLILLAGKGHEEYEITREGKRPFSEKDLVQRAYLERMQKTKETASPSPSSNTENSP